MSSDDDRNSSSDSLSTVTASSKNSAKQGKCPEPCPAVNPSVSPSSPVTTKAPPPVIVEGIPATFRQPQIAAELRRLFPTIKFINVRRLPRGGILIKTEYPKDYALLLKAWPTDAFGGISLTQRVPSDSPRKTIVIRGIPLDTSDEEIEEELKLREVKFSTFARIKSARTQQITPLIKLTITDINQATTLLKNGIILWFRRFRVEEPNFPDNNVLQCFNCQRFGHTKNACTAKPRCVRCSGEHTVNACPKERNDTTCSNCGGQHAASFRGCPKFKFVAAIRDKFSNIQRGQSAPVSITKFPSLSKHTTTTVNHPTTSMQQQVRSYADTVKQAPVPRRKEQEQPKAHNLGFSYINPAHVIAFIVQVLIAAGNENINRDQFLIASSKAAQRHLLLPGLSPDVLEKHIVDGLLGPSK